MALQVKNEQDEKITDLSSKLSTYKDGLEKTSNKETQLHPLVLQVEQDQDEKITDLSSKLSTYSYRLNKMNINET